MSDHAYPHRVQQALDALPAGALALALDQLRFAGCEDEQLGVVNESYIQWMDGVAVSKAANTIGRRRRAERCTGSMIDILDGSWADISPIWPGSSAWDNPVTWLETEQSMETQQEGQAQWWLTRLLQCWRSVQAVMRRICRAEEAGQGVLPGMAPGAEVYAAWRRNCGQSVAQKIEVVAVPETIEQPKSTATNWIQRCGRAVKATMRRICRIEHAGQMVLPCVPPAAEVHLQSVQGGAA